MSGGTEFNDAALWRRWREGQAEAGEAVAEPDALALAAYAENRLGRRGSDPEFDPAVAAVEAWLAVHPEALADVMAARTADEPRADVALIARAQALIARPEGAVVALHPVRFQWRNAVAWSGIAASLIAAVLIGFSLGDDGAGLPGGQPASIEQQALIGSPGSILVNDDEDTGI